MPSSLLEKGSWLEACSGLTGAVPHQVKAVGVEMLGVPGQNRVHAYRCFPHRVLSAAGRPWVCAASAANTLSLTTASLWMLPALSSEKRCVWNDWDRLCCAVYNSGPQSKHAPNLSFQAGWLVKDSRWHNGNDLHRKIACSISLVFVNLYGCLDLTD